MVEAKETRVAIGGTPLDAILEQARGRLPRHFSEVRAVEALEGPELEFTPREPGPGTVRVRIDPALTKGRLPTVAKGPVRAGWSEFEIRRYDVRSGLSIMLIFVTHLTFALPVAFLVLDPLGLRRIDDPTGGILTTFLLVIPILVYALVALAIVVRAVRPRWTTLAVILDDEGRNMGQSWTAQGDLMAARRIVENSFLRGIMEGREVAAVRLRGSHVTVEARTRATSESSRALESSLAGLACDLASLVATIAELEPKQERKEVPG